MNRTERLFCICFALLMAITDPVLALPFGDINCDNNANIVDVQLAIVAALNATLSPELDTNGNGYPDGCDSLAAVTCGAGTVLSGDACICGECGNNGQPCDDGNSCTTGETCFQGACTNGVVINCDDGDVCTADSCLPTSGCIHPKSPGCGGTCEPELESLVWTETIQFGRGYAAGADIQYGLLYVAWETSLQIYDVSLPANPTPVGLVQTPGVAYDVEVLGNIAYVADLAAGITLIDVSNPNTPMVINTLPLNDAFSVVGKGTTLVVSTYAALIIVDVTNPYAPVVVATYPMADGAGYLSWDQDILALANGLTSLVLLDMADVSDPDIVYSGTSGSTYAVPVVHGDYLFVGGYYDGLKVYHIADPTTPQLVFSEPPKPINDLMVIGNDLLLVLQYDGNDRVLNISNPALPVQVGTHTGPLYGLWALTHLGDVAFTTGTDGVTIISLANPTAGVDLATVGEPGAAEEIVVQSNIAYMADQDLGLRILDVTSPETPIPLTTVLAVAPAYHVHVSGNMAYVSGKDGTTVTALNVSNPAAPVVTAEFGPVEVWMTQRVANRLYVAEHHGFRILEAGNPAALTQLGAIGGKGGGFGFTMQVVGTTLYIGGNRLRIYDVANPSNIQLLSELPLADPNDWTRALRIEGNLAYMGSDVSQFRVVDISVPTNPQVIWQGPPEFTYMSDIQISAGLAVTSRSVGSIALWDLTNPLAPQLLSELATVGSAHGLAKLGGYVLVADGGGGLVVAQIGCQDL
ncbi:MAG: hypothetical protein HUU55_05670 [Myxococcales bacterium]|nr:hypothetical protein [Myxococcales bacterium]